ncbi:MAG: rhomboid family intramembrane serine protease, partial [Actinomycetota bacterium]
MSLPQPTIPRCYRHADREAGRHCTRCGKPACSECLVQASVGSHCLDCAKAAQPDVATRVKLASSRMLTPVTYTIIGLNLAVFIWMGIKDPQAWSGHITQAHVDLGLSRNILKYGVLYNDGSHDPTHQWYRLVTSGFIHFGIFHILMNMFLLLQLGKLLERAVGGTRLALMYTASLLAGSAGVVILGANGLTGGASGAVFGLMAGAAVGLHRRGVNIVARGNPADKHWRPGFFDEVEHGLDA